MNKLGPNDIEVILKLDQVIFRSGDAYEQIAPVVHLAQHSSEYRVLAVGNVSEISEKAIRINLFDGQGFNLGDFDKAAVLESFFHYGINKMLSRSAMIRPRVKLVFGDKISSVFGGYEKMILMRIVGNAGAREVVFNSTSHAS
jgi:hypothetical protein